MVFGEREMGYRGIAGGGARLVLRVSGDRLTRYGFILAGVGHSSPGSGGLRRRAAQGGRPQQIVRDGEPQEHGTNLLAAADQQAISAAVAQMGVDAFVLGALAIDRLALLARHPLPPSRRPGTVLLARGERVGLVLVVWRWDEDREAGGMRGFDIVDLVEAAIDQVLLRRLPIGRRDLLLHRP